MTATAFAELSERVNVALSSLSLDAPRDVEPLAAAMRYSLLAGGKRIRPALCLAVAESVGGELESAMPTALAVELVHTFSLVHDDLPALDNDNLRRGRPTAHVQFGEDTAILSGDALLTVAFALIADVQTGSAERRVATISELARAIGLAGMIGGQYRDLRALDGLERTSRLKTGALLAASCSCGATIGGASRPVIAAARRFGEELGLLFQIVDDILDVTGADETIGKPAGSDERQGRVTFASELGVDGARARAADVETSVRAALAELPGDPSTLAAVVELVAKRDR